MNVGHCLLQGILLRIAVLSSVSSTCTRAAFQPSNRGDSRFFLDTADIRYWDVWLPTGIFHGVTTNPVLLERAGHPCTVPSLHKLARRALTATDEFMCQAWGETANDMYDIGMKLSEPSRDRIVVKVPVTIEGTECARQLIQSGVRVCLTACYSAQQALIASGVGAEYIAPYCGRMTDAGMDGKQECIRMNDIVDGLRSDTRILVASLRDAETLTELAESGMDTFTFSPEVARSLFDVPLTRQAASEFEEAAKRTLHEGWS